MHKIYHRILAGTAALALLLGSWRGHIALFMEGGDAPLEVYPVPLDLLPVADQKQLREGIAIGDAAELARILEDLLS